MLPDRVSNTGPLTYKSGGKYSYRVDRGNSIDPEQTGGTVSSESVLFAILGTVVQH